MGIYIIIIISHRSYNKMPKTYALSHKWNQNKSLNRKSLPTIVRNAKDVNEMVVHIN